MTTYADIPALETQWLGKGQLMCDLAARVANSHSESVSSDSGETGSVIMITLEDDLSETVAYRLRAAGANLARVHDMTLLGSRVTVRTVRVTAPGRERRSVRLETRS